MMAAPSLKSQRQLAESLGKSQPAIAKWLKDARWPFSRTAPWSSKDVPAMQEWARRTLAPDPAAAGGGQPQRGGMTIRDLDPGRQADVAIKLEKLKGLQLAREIKLGQYHRTDECEQRRVRQIQAVKTELLNLAGSLPFPQEQKDVVQGRVQEILMRFAGSR